MDSIASNLNCCLYHPSTNCSSQEPRRFLLPTRRRRHMSSCWTTTTTTSWRLPGLLHVTPPLPTNSKFRRLHHRSFYKNKKLISTCSCCCNNRATGYKDDGDDHVDGLHHRDMKFNVKYGAAGKAVFGFLAAASAFFSLHSHSPALAESLTVAFPVSRAREVLTPSNTTPHIITFFQFLLILLLLWFCHLI